MMKIVIIAFIVAPFILIVLAKETALNLTTSLHEKQLNHKDHAKIDDEINGLNSLATLLPFGFNTNSSPSSEKNIQLEKGTGLNNSNSNINNNETMKYANVNQCSKNDYDLIIEEKRNSNNISRPIIESNGRFDNPFSTWHKMSYLEIVQFILSFELNDSKEPKDIDELNKEFPIIKPTFINSSALDTDFRVTWIGHSTLLIQVDGLNILTDPIFAELGSASYYFGAKRYRQSACDINSLPKIDIVLISHNHHDHLDSNSVSEINNRFGSQCRWLVPIGVGEFMKSMSIENYVELDWWQKDCFQLENNSSTVSTDNSETKRATKKITKRPELSIYLTPAQHQSFRGSFDFMKTLWGSFSIVSSRGSTFFFGGDTGYCPAFKEIGEVFGPFTGAALPIGAYGPTNLLKTIHANPNEAIQIHRDIKSMKSIAIHHGTFVLSAEPYNEPKEILETSMADLMANNTLREPFIAIKHGDSVDFFRNY